MSKVQAYVSSEDCKLFDISINTDEISFKILELSKEEVFKLFEDITEQIEQLEDAYENV